MLRPVLFLSLIVGAATTQPIPQAIVDYDRPPPRFGNEAKETHVVRGESVRIDQRVIPANTRITIVRQQYTRTGQPFTFETTRSADGQLIGARIADDPLSAPPAKALRRSAGPREKHAGETCQPWEVVRKISQDQSFVQSGCAAVDGIELWRKQGRVDAIYATKIRRTVVAEDAVRLPFEALDTTRLVQREAGNNHHSDYEVLLTGSGDDKQLHRRSGNWLYVEEVVGQSLVILVRNISTGVEIHYSRTKDGQRQWFWSRPFQPAREAPARQTTATGPAAKQKTILGEQCTWQNSWPDVIVHDASKSDCRTNDGIPLAIAQTNWGFTRYLTATRLSRRVQPVSAILLPIELTSRAAWEGARKPLAD